MPRIVILRLVRVVKDIFRGCKEFFTGCLGKAKVCHVHKAMLLAGLMDRLCNCQLFFGGCFSNHHASVLEKGLQVDGRNVASVGSGSHGGNEVISSGREWVWMAFWEPFKMLKRQKKYDAGGGKLCRNRRKDPLFAKGEKIHDLVTSALCDFLSKMRCWLAPSKT